MDPDAFSASMFKWDLRGMAVPPSRVQLEAAAVSPQQAAAAAAAAGYSVRGPREVVGLEDMFRAYGVRYYTAARIADLGFTVSTLLDMKDEELDDMMNSVSQFFRVELLVGERYGIKAAIRAERRRLEEEDSRRRHALSGDANAMDALSQEGLSEEPVQQEKEMVGSGGGAAWEVVTAAEKRKKLRRIRRGVGGGHRSSNEGVDDDEEEEENEDGINGGGGEHPSRALAMRGGGRERQREHPFIVTEAGEVARGKKNGLDYLFHLYEQCHEFLTQVQNIAKQRGEKCPTKVTNQVFRYAKKEGANYINKPKMRHYVHCYALHCLDEEGSNALRRECKLRGENIGTWRQACYRPVVEIAAGQGWDIDAIFSAHPQLSVWYVPTKLRQLCHAERNNATASSSASGGSGTADHLPY
ncbi:floricaula/leafy homolog [Rosa rugosa]|nr:floricaula/leafy homolog [Rosa rugosa]